MIFLKNFIVFISITVTTLSLASPPFKSVNKQRIYERFKIDLKNNSDAKKILEDGILTDKVLSRFRLSVKRGPRMLGGRASHIKVSDDKTEAREDFKSLRQEWNKDFKDKFHGTPS